MSVTNLLPSEQQRPFSETYVVSKMWSEEGRGKPVLGVSLFCGLPRGFVQLDRKGEINMTEVNSFFTLMNVSITDVIKSSINGYMLY